MPLLVNPEFRRLKIKLREEEGHVVMVVSTPTREDWAELNKGRFIKADGGVKDESYQKRLEMINHILHDVEYYNGKGVRDQVLYRDEKGEQRELTNSVPNWTDYVDETWKQAVGLGLEASLARLEASVLKN